MPRTRPTAIKVVRKSVFPGASFTQSLIYDIGGSAFLLGNMTTWGPFRLRWYYLVLPAIAKFNNVVQEVIIILFHLVPMMSIRVKVESPEGVRFLWSRSLGWGQLVRFVVVSSCTPSLSHFCGSGEVNGIVSERYSRTRFRISPSGFGGEAVLLCEQGCGRRCASGLWLNDFPHVWKLGCRWNRHRR